jgi:hypothetical protein
MLKNNRIFFAVIIGLFCVPAMADNKVYEGTWNEGARATFSIESEDIITYCFEKTPCSRFRFKGSLDLIQITFPRQADYVGAYMELIKKPNGRYLGEYYYGEEASSKIGTKSVAVFVAR